jgi:radical SAM protein with 4Fe4S-binding SPASM domain
MDKSVITTTANQSNLISETFTDPADYIYNIYKKVSEKKANDFLQYRINWKASQEFTKVFSFPLYILTELTFSCNYRCPQCILGNVEETIKLKPDIPEMPISLFKKIIDEGEKHQCRSLCLNHTNEPLLVKDLVDRISYAQNHGFLDILMNTNGELLNENISKKIIQSGLTRLMISLDANSQETFKKIRVGGNFEKVCNNIKNFIKIRDEMGLKLPLVRTSFVLQKSNAHELNEFTNYWKEKVDYVHIQNFSRPYETSDDSRISIKKLNSKNTFRCDQPNNRIVIRSDGQVLPCCSWFSYEIPVGNVNDKSIYEIWNSKLMKDLRKIHYAGQYNLNPTCEKCVNSF